MPLTSGARREAGLAHQAVAALFVRPASIELPTPIGAVASLYGLSNSEVRVLYSLMETSGAAEVAAVLGISEATVRTHLRHLFDKTGTNRQADLVRLVAGFSGPF